MTEQDTKNTFSNRTEWISVKEILGTKLPLNLATTTLKIKTDPITDSSSEEMIDVRLYDNTGEEAGQIILKLREPLQYKLGNCMSSYLEFPNQLQINRNVDEDDVWGISMSSGKDIVITCNEQVCCVRYLDLEVLT